MKNIVLIFCGLIFIVSCEKEKQNTTPNYDCLEIELDTIPDEFFHAAEWDTLLCYFIEVDDVNFIDEKNYSWLPEVCSEIHDEMVFVSSSDKSTFELLSKKHYISKHIVLYDCLSFFEKSTLIKQTNEVIRLEYQNYMFGVEPIVLDLRSIIVNNNGPEPFPKVDLISIRQKSVGSNENSIYARHTIDKTNNILHDKISLNDIEYNEVIEIKEMIDYNFTLLPVSFFFSSEYGFLAFELQEKTWVKE